MAGGDGGDDGARLAADTAAAPDRDGGLARADQRAGSVAVPRARLIVAATAAVVAVAILLLSRNFNFYFDEWTFILSAPDWTPLTYLQPHNVHPVMLTRAVWAVLLNTAGLRSYAPYMAVLLGLHAVNVLLLFELVRRRAGDLVGLGAAALLVVLGAGWENLLWAFQLMFLGSVACGLGALLVVQLRSTPLGVGATVALLTVALMFSSIGVFFVVAVAVYLYSLDERRHQLVWLAPLVAAVILWYAVFGRNGAPTYPPPTAMNLLLTWPYALWGIGESAAALVGEGGWWGPPSLVVAVGVIAWRWSRNRPDGIALGVALGFVTFYLVTGLSRAQFGFEQAGSGRYVYEGAIFWILLLSDAAASLPWRGTWRPALAALVFLACFNSAALLFEYGTAKTVQMQREGADLQALNSVRGDPCLKPTGDPDPLVMPWVSNPAQYYRAVDLYGDPAPAGPVRDRPDYDRARMNLLFTNCR